MKEAKKIIVPLITLFLIQACATTNNKEFIVDQEKPVVIAESVLIEQLKVSELSNVQLNAFEQKGLQRLKDLEDYVNLLSNEEVETRFKDQAREQAIKLFIDNELIISALSDVTQSGTTSYSFNEPRIISGLEQRDNIYSGQMEFQLLEYDQDQVKIGSAMKTVDFFVVQNTKTFGDHEEVIWEVLLGQLNFSTLE